MGYLDLTHQATLRRLGLDGLTNPHLGVRKRAARALVKDLTRAGVLETSKLFAGEPSPEVYKWLGMALARAAGPQAISILSRKREQAHDANARDWLLAAESVADRYPAQRTSEQMLLSSDTSDKSDGAIRIWGLGVLSARAKAELVRCAAESTDPRLRRWCLLSLHEHQVEPETAVLIDNLAADDYLLREWSLHAIVRFPSPPVQSKVLAIVAEPTAEHPRVLEWAVHAASSADLNNQDVDEMLIRLHSQSADVDVQEACLAELGRRLNAPAEEYLRYVCSQVDTAADLAAILSRRTVDSRTLPSRLMSEMEEASLRVDPRDPNLRYFYNALPIRRDVQIYFEKGMGNPANRMYLRGRLSQHREDEDLLMGDIAPLRAGIVVALKEEYDYIAESVRLKHEVHSVSRESYYLGQLIGRGTPVELIVSLVGRKGSSFAATATERLLSDYVPDIVLSLGISGAIHPKDAHLADIVLAESSTAYFDNFKVLDGPGGGPDFKAGTETFRSDPWLIDRAVRLDIEDQEVFQEWLGKIAEIRAPSNLGQAQILTGPIAAGPGVVASDNFKDWIRRLNRSFIAVDMESSGVAQVSWTKPGGARLLLVRGISDGADGNKDGLDTAIGINYRRLAMLSATTYALAVLKSLADRRSEF